MATRFGRGRAPELDPDADPVEVGREIALRALTVRDRSRAELAAALARRGVPAEAAETVLERLGEVGLVDDEQFAAAWVAGRQRRNTSARVLRQELRAKGIEAELVTQAMDALPEGAELAAARALVAKRARSLGGVDAVVRRRRLAGQLARRGFGPSIIATVLREGDAEEAAELDGYVDLDNETDALG